MSRLLSIKDLEAAWPIESAAILRHVKAGRLRAYDFSMCGKGPYGVRAADADAFLEEHLLVTPPAEKPRESTHARRRREATHSDRLASSRI